MPRPKLSPAARIAKLQSDLDLAAYSIAAAQKAIASGDQAKLADACKMLEAVGCYGRRTDLPAPASTPNGAIQATQRVKVYGPNLADQSKGNFHVHADGCSKKPRLLFGGTDDHPMVIDAKDKLGIVADVYEDMIYSNDQDPVESFETDLHFCSCVKLPRGNPDDYRA